MAKDSDGDFAVATVDPRTLSRIFPDDPGRAKNDLPESTGSMAI